MITASEALRLSCEAQLKENEEVAKMTDNFLEDTVASKINSAIQSGLFYTEINLKQFKNKVEEEIIQRLQNESYKCVLLSPELDRVWRIRWSD